MYLLIYTPFDQLYLLDRSSNVTADEGGEADKAEDLLSFRDLRVIYDLCRFGKAIFPEKESVWCEAFSIEDLKVKVIC